MVYAYNNLWSFEIVFNNKHDSDKFSRHINRVFTYLLTCLLALNTLRDDTTLNYRIHQSGVYMGQSVAWNLAQDLDNNLSDTGRVNLLLLLIIL
jgi:phenolic acid decarboxylase